jgi:hypothetical protein
MSELSALKRLLNERKCPGLYHALRQAPFRHARHHDDRGMLTYLTNVAEQRQASISGIRKSVIRHGSLCSVVPAALLSWTAVLLRGRVADGTLAYRLKLSEWRDRHRRLARSQGTP